jgi:hypothetical protein
MRKTFYLFILCVFVLSCNKNEIKVETASKLLKGENYDVVWEWNRLFLEVNKVAPGYHSAPTSAAFGMLNLAVYESCLSGMPGYKSIAKLHGIVIPNPDQNAAYHWPTVINHVNSTFITQLYPHVSEDQKTTIITLRNKLDVEYSFLTNEATIQASKAYGQQVANAVWEQWKKWNPESFDQYKDPYGDYDWKSRTNIGRWQPTENEKPLFPYWGRVKPLAIREDQKICASFEKYVDSWSEDGDSKLYSNAEEVMFNQFSELSYSYSLEGKIDFWNDNTPGVTYSYALRFLSIANQIYKLEKIDLEKAVFCNVKLGLACHDGGVGAITSAYHYNLERPRTYINRIIHASWEVNFFKTPIAYPTYPSAHTTIASSMATVLEDVFGQYDFTDRTYENNPNVYDVPRTYNNFTEAVEELALTKLYSGVDWRQDQEEALIFGKQIGAAVNSLPWK